MLKANSQGANRQQVLPGEERRRSQRVMIRVPVTLSFTVAGKKVMVDATTVSVNDHGAMLSCTRPISPDVNLEIINGRTDEKQACRVTRAPVESPDGYLIPIEFIAPCPGYWRISFPPTNWKAVED